MFTEVIVPGRVASACYIFEKLSASSSSASISSASARCSAPSTSRVKDIVKALSAASLISTSSVASVLPASGTNTKAVIPLAVTKALATSSTTTLTTIPASIPTRPATAVQIGEKPFFGPYAGSATNGPSEPLILAHTVAGPIGTSAAPLLDKFAPAASSSSTASSSRSSSDSRLNSGPPEVASSSSSSWVSYTSSSSSASQLDCSGAVHDSPPSPAPSPALTAPSQSPSSGSRVNPSVPPKAAPAAPSSSSFASSLFSNKEACGPVLHKVPTITPSFIKPVEVKTGIVAALGRAVQSADRAARKSVRSIKRATRRAIDAVQPPEPEVNKTAQLLTYLADHGDALASPNGVVGERPDYIDADEAANFHGPGRALVRNLGSTHFQLMTCIKRDAPGSLVDLMGGYLMNPRNGKAAVTRKAVARVGAVMQVYPDLRADYALMFETSLRVPKKHAIRERYSDELCDRIADQAVALDEELHALFPALFKNTTRAASAAAYLQYVARLEDVLSDKAEALGNDPDKTSRELAAMALLHLARAAPYRKPAPRPLRKGKKLPKCPAVHCKSWATITDEQRNEIIGMYCLIQHIGRSNQEWDVCE
ncbi:hypothetical protein H9P43_002869 [Blastocladiella emersonii ATCC 22665]|nr:hypothetical protein H9P43_002869 [Blastocladiella emersonii ATCC 22665]